MKHILKKLPWLLRATIGFSLLMTFVYCVIIWPLDTLCILFLWTWATEKIVEHWQTLLAIIVTALLSIGSAAIIGYGIGWFCHWSNDTSALVSFFVSIYTLGIIIEPSNRKPYIWLYRQLKKLFAHRVRHIIAT